MSERLHSGDILRDRFDEEQQARSDLLSCNLWCPLLLLQSQEEDRPCYKPQHPVSARCPRSSDQYLI